MTPWGHCVAILRSIPPRRCIDGQIKFKGATPDDVVAYMRKFPAANTVDAIMQGMRIKRSTAKRLLGTAVDAGLLLVDKECHPKHFIYRIPGEE